ncbi:MAG: phenylacetate--CoA ligase family protein [Alphaproteobacteria bacterium]|nr:phenylacetate--CoA ligase family protein [Alphaproteobacteria bacterium]
MVENFPFVARARITEVQERRFLAMLDLCFERHPHYRRVFAKAGLRRGDFTSLADIVKLPLTSKRDLMADPEAFRLDTAGLATEMQVTWDVMHTTGTSAGRPTPFYSTSYDFYGLLTANRRALEIRGVRDGDLIANLCPMTLHPAGAYHRAVAAASAMKIPILSLIPGRPSPHFHWGSGLDESVAAIARARATILWGVASYVRRVVMRASELGADLSAVRLVFMMGEPVTEAMRDDVVGRLERLGAAAPRVSVSYAATEMQVGTVECHPGAGYHNPAPEQFHFEVVDPATHRPLPDGERGLIVLTHLDRTGTVLLRYALGDLSAIARTPCPHCGATTDRFVELPQRADDMLKIRGMLVNPALLLDTLAGDPDIREFQVVIDHEAPDDPLSMDRLVLRLAVAADVATLTARIAVRVRAAIGVRPEIEIVPASELYDEARAWKAQRVVDRRRNRD